MILLKMKIKNRYHFFLIRKDLKETKVNFINKEMIHYAMDSNARAIPNVMDGLKPS